MTLNRLDDSGQPLSPDFQRTTLSLDLMGRFLCNTWDEAVNNGGPPFDAVVIGSGMFGGYCAEHLFRKSKLRVLVLDAGPCKFHLEVTAPSCLKRLLCGPIAFPHRRFRESHPYGAGAHPKGR